jgi:hypothetical protein
VEAVAEMAEKASVLGIGREKKDITRLIIGGGVAWELKQVIIVL